MTAVFTRTDKALIDRAARLVLDQAKIEENLHGPVWAATAEGKDAKRRFDRLQRDARDLRALARRLEKAMPVAVYPEHGATNVLTTGNPGGALAGEIVGNDTQL